MIEKDSKLNMSPGNIENDQPGRVSGEFIQEILSLKEQEEKGGETAHFRGIEINENILKPEDEVIWKKIKGGNITWQEFREYQLKTMAEVSKQRETDKESAQHRSDFLSFMGNMMVKVLSQKKENEE